MKPDTGGRIFSWIILSLLVTFWLQHRMAAEEAMGRAAYLAAQAAHYDKNIAHHVPIWALAIVFAVMVGIFLLIYEWVARLSARMLASGSSGPDSAQGISAGAPGA